MATLSNAQLQFYASRHITEKYWAGGDSYIGGATAGSETASLPISLRAKGYLIINDGVGGSDMPGIRDRLILNASLIKRCSALLVWDGSANGYVDATSYANELAEGLSAVSDVPLILIPAANPYTAGPAGPTPIAIRDEFLSRWPGALLDWRDWIANTDGVINQDRMLDSIHINTTANDEMADGVETML